MTDRLIGEGVAVVVVDGNENIAAGSAISDGLSALNLEGKTTYRFDRWYIEQSATLD